MRHPRNSPNAKSRAVGGIVELAQQLADNVEISEQSASDQDILLRFDLRFHHESALPRTAPRLITALLLLGPRWRDRLKKFITTANNTDPSVD